MPATDADHLTLTTQEIRVINYWRRLRFGELTIKVRHGRPCRIEQALRDIDLEDEQEPMPEPLKEKDRAAR